MNVLCYIFASCFHNPNPNSNLFLNEKLEVVFGIANEVNFPFLAEGSFNQSLSEPGREREREEEKGREREMLFNAM